MVERVSRRAEDPERSEGSGWRESAGRVRTQEMIGAAGESMARGQVRATENGLGKEIERKLWAAADKPRGSMDAAEYKHVALAAMESHG